MGLKDDSFRRGARLAILGSSREVCVLYNYSAPIPSHSRDGVDQVLLAGGDFPRCAYLHMTLPLYPLLNSNVVVVDDDDNNYYYFIYSAHQTPASQKCR